MSTATQTTGDPICPHCGQYLSLHYYDCAATTYHRSPLMVGCVCPPTSEQTCQNPFCARKNPIPVAGAV